MRHQRRRLGVVSASALSSSDVSSRVVSSCVWLLGMLQSSSIEFIEMWYRDSPSSTALEAKRPAIDDEKAWSESYDDQPTDQSMHPSINQPRAPVETDTYIDLIPSTETRVRDGLSKTHNLPAELADGTHTHSLHVVSRHAVRVAGWEEDIEELVGIGLCAAWTLVDGLTRAAADGGGRVGRAHDDVDSRGRGNVGCGRGA
jgi:hypothetical protein